MDDSNDIPILPRLRFISAYQGEIDYVVMDGSMAGERIHVRELTAAAEEEFEIFRTAVGHAERLASAGCVVRASNPRVAVPDEVLAVAQQGLAERRAALVAAGVGVGVGRLVETLSAAVWVPGLGYERVGCRSPGPVSNTEVGMVSSVQVLGSA